MLTHAPFLKVYDGDGDLLMHKDRHDDIAGESITLIPDAMPSRVPDSKPRIRIMWGQHLLDDLRLGRYKSLVCAVNGRDNSHGVISQLAAMLPTSQWDEKSITAYAAHFSHASSFATAGERQARPKVLKFDMDMVEVLAILRPLASPHLTVEHLSHAFRIVSEMIAHNARRLPVASVSFLGARANALVDDRGAQPSFETVLRTMYAAGYTGDVYPPPALWRAQAIGVFARYPFTRALDDLREGGF
jgi:hypothetical protein